MPTAYHKEYIRVPSRNVEMEDGRIIDTAPFLISREPITLGEFREFALSTGYCTTAEREGQSDIYLSNEAIAGFPAEEADSMPVCCVSYLDASAYCQWSQVRIPSEEQWIAAALVESTVYTREQFNSLFGAGGQFKLASHPNALRSLGSEWTSTANHNGVVIRSGPQFVRLDNWRTMISNHRWVVPETFFDVTVSFRVVRNT